MEEIRNRFAKEKDNKENKDKENGDASRVVAKIFDEAVVHNANTDEELRQRMIDTAKKYTDTKMGVIKSEVDTEDKKAFFDNKKDACSVFGYNEGTTEKWAVSYMAVWYNIMNAIWITLGFFTFAPVSFVAKKLSVIITHSWVAVVVAIIIWIGIVLSPLILANI